MWWNMANPRRMSHVIHLLKKPQSVPLLLSFFVLLTWISLRLQHHSPPAFHSSSQLKSTGASDLSGEDEDANLVRFSSLSSSQIRKDNRGWLLNPISIARSFRIKGGAVSCVSIHVAEIRPGGMRGNHRHHTCNETLVIWGAKTRFRLENHKMAKGYAEVEIREDEVGVAGSGRGSAHALINVDPLRSTFIIGCQDNDLLSNSSNTDFNVWKPL